MVVCRWREMRGAELQVTRSHDRISATGDTVNGWRKLVWRGARCSRRRLLLTYLGILPGLYRNIQHGKVHVGLLYPGNIYDSSLSSEFTYCPILLLGNPFRTYQYRHSDPSKI